MKFLIILCVVGAFGRVESGYVYERPSHPITPITGGRSCECPNEPPVDVERVVFRYTGYQGHYNVSIWKPKEDMVRVRNITKNFNLTYDEIEITPKYEEMKVDVHYERLNVTTWEEPIEKPIKVDLKEKCETINYEPPDVIRIYKNRTFYVVVDKIIERPVYNHIFNVTYVDVPVDVEVEQIIERPYYKNKTVTKIVEIPIINMITHITLEKPIDLRVERVPSYANFTAIYLEGTPKIDCLKTPPAPHCPPYSCPRTTIDCAPCECTPRVYIPPGPTYIPPHPTYIPPIVNK